MERCEVCGRAIYGKPYLVVIEGAVMRVCSECAKLGKPYTPGARAPAPGTQRHAPGPGARGSRDEDLEELILVPDYHRLVKEARERLGLTQEELAAKAGLKASVISKVESGRFRPDVQTARRLEGILRIRILARMDELET